MRMEFVCERAQTNDWVKVVLFVFFHCCLSSMKLTKLPLLFLSVSTAFFSLFQFKLFVSQHFFYSFIPYPWNLYRIDKSCFFATIRILRMDDPHTCLHCLPYKYGEYVCRLNAMRQPTKQKESRQFRISFCFARNFQASEFA